MGYKIPIHLLHTQAFCEYQIYLGYVKGFKAPETPEIRKGKDVHQELEKNHLEKAEGAISIKGAISKAKKEKVTLVMREVPVEGECLYGLIDEINFTPSSIIIIDDKPGNYPYISNKKQVWGYCLAFKENYKPSLPLIAALRQRDSQDIFWEELFLEEHKEQALESTQRIIDIIKGVREPQPTSNSYKCRNCRWNNLCDVFSNKN